MTYGLSIEVVFERFYNRVKLDDAKYIASSLTLLNKTGGNIVKVFGTREKSFFSKKKRKQEMQKYNYNKVFEVVYHPNGNLCSGWDGTQEILLNYQDL